jgi:hypothetical protein
MVLYGTELSDEAVKMLQDMTVKKAKEHPAFKGLRDSILEELCKPEVEKKPKSKD